MKILVACEESQKVCLAFRNKGHEAFSCDLLPCSGNHPEWHLQDNVLNYIDFDWDMIVAFPPCTYLTVTGNRWFNIKKYGQKAIDRYNDRLQAIDFFMMFALHKCKKVVIENPVGIMSGVFRKPDQIIEPFMFGEPFEKKTCLWLKGVPKLIPTNIVIPEGRIKFDSGKSMPKWYAELWNIDSEMRSKIRSKTFNGIALAMAEQWG